MYDELCEDFIYLMWQDYINSITRRLILKMDVPISNAIPMLPYGAPYKKIRIWSPKYSINLIAPKEI
jgi:hypothetical protein